MKQTFDTAADAFIELVNELARRLIEQGLLDPEALDENEERD